ncbi:hypothetical protein H4R22_003415 [Coemansia sp. RSA 1290]|nr:hypothetical protein H4R22_003415 [Coemansia sp. RSA 1290]KAJ2646245.1 hypothetical protein IWW40_005550 [Coemansia sp. RSA 1250]
MGGKGKKRKSHKSRSVAKSSASKSVAQEQPVVDTPEAAEQTTTVSQPNTATETLPKTKPNDNDMTTSTDRQKVSEQQPPVQLPEQTESTQQIPEQHCPQQQPEKSTALTTTAVANYGAIPPAKPATEETSLLSSPGTVASPCSRCQRIISVGHSEAASSNVTRAEATLVPKFIAAQVGDEELRMISQQKGHKVAAFYEQQNELIEELLGVNRQHTDDVLEAQSEQRRRRQLQVDRAVQVSVVVNVLVVIAQLYAAVSSESLALFATMSEASMDLLSSIILLLASAAARRNDRFSLYPSGRFKLETIGVIIFAVLMGTFSVALLAESIAALVAAESMPNNLSIYDAACVVAALLAKVVLFWYCYSLREYHAAHVLMTDHRNDVIVNAFGLTMAVVGKHVMPWMDPLGSLIIALMILRSWILEAWDQIKLIVGIRADPRLLQVLTFTALTHDPRIEKVDRIVAYHSGAKLFVEVDIVMPPATPLVTLHDVAESLQEKYERMPGVGRCHVHVDYEVTHRSEHQNAAA